MPQFARPDSDVSKGSWDDPNGNNNDILYDDIDEASASDSDYIETAVDADTCEIGLSNVTDPVSSSDHTIRYRARRVGGTPPTVTVKLFDGPTEIASHTSAGLGTAFADYSYTLTGAEANNIGDYTDLRLKFTTALFGQSVDVSWAEFEVPSEFTLEQEGYRWRDDDADEDEAAWLDSQDTNITRAKSTNTRLRVLTNATNNPPTQQLKLQYRKVGDPDSEWRDIP